MKLNVLTDWFVTDVPNDLAMCESRDALHCSDETFRVCDQRLRRMRELQQAQSEQPS